MEMSLAIVEQGQGQRPVAGCVGVMFLHLLDWNRRLAKKKKKRFAKRSLLPPLLKRCPKQSSPCPSHSHSPLPQLTSSEKPQMDTTTPMRAPGLVARLMGLESMPASKPGKPHKDPSTQFQPNKGYTQPSKDLCLEAWPLKMQKTSNGSGDFIVNSGSTQLKKYNHNSACSRSPRARLIQAAAKILEPGLRPKLPFSPSNSSVRILEENREIKINIGNFSENEMETMVISGKLQKVNLPAKTNILEDATDTREDALKYTVRGRKCTHEEQRVKNLVISGPKMEINHHLQRNTGERRKISKAAPKTKISGANLNKRVTNKPIESGYFGPKKNLKHAVKSGTINNSINTENRKRRTASDVSKKTEPVRFGDRSSNRVISPKREMVIKKRENNGALSLVSSSLGKPVTKKNTVNGVDQKQIISLEKESVKVKDYASNLIGSILEDLVLEISEETGLCLSGGKTPCIDASQGERINGLSTYLATLDSDQPSPLSILEVSFSNDSCSSGSPIDETDGKMLFGSKDAVPKLLDFDSSDVPTEAISDLNIQILGSRVGCTSEVFSNIELLFGKNRIEEENFSIHSFLLDLLRDVMEAFSGGLNGEKEGCRLTNFLFDCIMECLDWKFGYFCKSGYKGWLVISQSLRRDRLFKDTLKEMQRWSETAGKALYVLAEKDLRNSIERWSKCDFEGFEIGVEIESAIIHTLVDELVFDLH